MAYNVKFLKGTSTQLEGITRDLNTFYYVDDTDLFLGNIKLSNGADLAAAILRVAANEEDIKDLQDDIKALTGGETGSISGLIEEAVSAAKVELRKEISANTTAINAEKERAMGIEGGLETRLATVEGDYLKGSDKTELEGKITAEATTARAAEKANADAIAAVKEDVDAFFKDATISEAAKDTLKEIQTYIESDVEAAAAMTESINGVKDRVKAIEDDYLVEADKTELSNAINGKVAQGDFDTLSGTVNTLSTTVGTKADKSVVEGIDGRVSDVEGKLTDITSVKDAIATAKQGAIDTAAGDATTKSNKALSDAKTYTNEEIAKLGNVYDVKGAASSALTDAKAYADGLATNYDAAGAADTALESAKGYADSLATNYDAAGSANTALTNAKTYTNEEIAKLDKTYEKIGVAETKANAALDSAKAYADGLAVNYDAKGAAATAKSEAISAASSDATNKATTAENNAKAYVDTALTWGIIA